ncbi:GNAT family N-acetyltransferase [Weissella viridescens]|nr:GNAT family protein [Weissella viridescens]
MFVFTEFETPIGLVQLVFPESTYAPALFNVIQTHVSEFAKWLPWATTTDSVEAEVAFINDARMKNAQYELLSLVILVDGHPSGTIDLHDLEAEIHHAKIGYWLDPTYQGFGIMTEAVKQLTQRALTDLGFHKLTIEIDTLNEKSIAVAEHAGFTYEATLKDQIINEGEYRDVFLYTKLAD